MKTLLALARAYEVNLAVARDSVAAELLKAYKKVAKKAHPDKGGTAANFRHLQAAKEEGFQAPFSSGALSWGTAP